MKNNAKKLFFVLIVLNMLLIGAIVGVFTVASNVAAKKSQTISQLKADLETNDQALSNYTALQKTLDANKDLQKTLDKVLPADKDQSEAVALLDKFSQDASYPVKQITFNSGTNKGAGKTLTSPSSFKNVSTVSVTLHSSSAQYQNLLNFLKKIETTQRRMQVSSVIITPNASNPNLLDRVDLSVDIYLKSTGSK